MKTFNILVDNFKDTTEGLNIFFKGLITLVLLLILLTVGTAIVNLVMLAF